MPYSDSAIDLSCLGHTSVQRARPPAEVELEVLHLFDASSGALARYVATLGVPRPDVEDVTQDVFLALYRHLMRGLPRTHLRGWLYRVAHNLSLKHLRSRSRSRSNIESYLRLASRSANSAGNPEQALSESQRQQRLLSVFHALTPRDRQCLALRAEGLRYREISKVLGMSLGAVAKSVARSMQRLEIVDR